MGGWEQQASLGTGLASCLLLPDLERVVSRGKPEAKISSSAMSLMDSESLGRYGEKDSEVMPESQL